MPRTSDEVSLPLVVSSHRCANAETLEWRLKLGHNLSAPILATVFRNKTVGREHVVRALLQAALKD